MPRQRPGWRRSWPRWRRSPQPGAGAELPRWLGDARTPTQPDRGRRSARTPLRAGQARHPAPGTRPAGPLPPRHRGGGAAGPPSAPGRDPSAPGAGPRRLLSRQGGSGGGGDAAQGGKPSSQPLLPRPPSSSSSSCRRQHSPGRPSRRTALTRQHARWLPPSLPPAASRRERGPTGVGGAAPLARRGRGSARLGCSRRGSCPGPAPITRPAFYGPAGSAWAARSQGGLQGTDLSVSPSLGTGPASSVAQEGRGVRVGVPRRPIRMAAASGPWSSSSPGEKLQRPRCSTANQIAHAACREAYCYARKGLAVPLSQNTYARVRVHKHSVASIVRL